MLSEQRRVTALRAAVSPALLGEALARKRFLGLVLGRVGDVAQLTPAVRCGPIPE
jgi:hypothetical protein